MTSSSNESGALPRTVENLTPRLRRFAPLSESARRAPPGQFGPDQVWQGEYLVQWNGGASPVWPDTATAPAGWIEPVAISFGSSADASVIEQDLELYALQAQAGAQLNDERLLRVFDSATLPEGPAYQAVEFANAPSLRQRLHANGQMSLDDAVAMLSHVTQVLTRLHAAGIVHGRLRPEHLFPFASEASPFKLSPPAFFKTSGAATSRAQVIPRAYESPARLLQAELPTAQDDLWALAVTLYECLTTVLPFDAPTDAGEAVAICNAAFGPPSRYRVDLPLKLDLWFARALSKNPLDRFRTPSELYSSFSQACERDSSGRPLDRLDEDLDDEQTAQWELPEEWIAPSTEQVAVPAPQTVFTASLPHQTAQLAVSARAMPSQTAHSAPAPPVSVQPALSAAPPTASGSNTLSLLAGVMGAVLLVSLAIWQWLPQQPSSSANSPSPTQHLLTDEPARVAGALKVAADEESLQTINAAEFLAGSDRKTVPPARRTASKKTKRRRAKATQSKSAQSRTSGGKRLKKQSSKVVRRRSSTKKKAATGKDCVVIDSKGIRRIKPSCL